MWGGGDDIASQNNTLFAKRQGRANLIEHAAAVWPPAGR
jgi:hypothetical protein